MGRSRGVSNSTDDDANQRSKRRRVASSGENSEIVTTSLQAPSYHHMRVTLLKQVYEDTQKFVESFRPYWKRYGCSIMSDFWTDGKGRSLINFLVNCPKGTFFLKSIDASEHVKRADLIVEMIEEVIKDAGEDNIVQFITDNGSNFKSAGSILEGKYPKMFWAPCAAHCLNLMVKDLGESKASPLDKIENALKNARSIVVYIYNHGRILSLMRKCTDNRELHRSCVTRFATQFYTLESMIRNENVLRMMFVSNAWTTSDFSKTIEGRRVARIVHRKKFWDNAKFACSILAPLVDVIRLVDTKEKPCMGYLHEAMDRAKEQIKKNLGEDTAKTNEARRECRRVRTLVWNMIDKRWDDQLDRPLHSAGLYLNPGIYYKYSQSSDDSLSIEGNAEMKRGLFKVFNRLVPDLDENDKLIGELVLYREALQSFGEPQAIRTRETLAPGPGTSEGKKALYHCNYCNKDISGKIRIKCTKCPDFDLCVECFSVGAEVTPHKSNHPYRVMDNLSFPLIFPDWNADEEILLLEGIEMYGLGNWAEVAEHVGTKSKAQCIDHYTTAYMNSPCYPLPDMSRVNGKNRKELLAMAKVQGEGKKGFSMLGDVTPKEESPFSPSRVKMEDLSETPSGRSPSGLAAGASKKASNVGQFKDGTDGPKVEGLTTTEDLHLDRSIGVKKPKHSQDEGPSMTELSGYNAKRQEFDPEYDNEAELSLAEMEFKETDSESDRELKLRVLRIYLSRLDERKRRKNFILERNLLYPSPLEKELSIEDREFYQQFKVFMRFLSQEEYESLLKTVLEERKIRKRIQELQECRAAGCHTLSEANMYCEQKRKRELEANAQRLKESGQNVASDKAMKRPVNKERGESDGNSLSIIDNHKIESLSLKKSFNDWDIFGLPGAELLSESEQQLCSQCRILPSLYLKMQEVLFQEIFKGSVVKKSDAHPLFKVDPTKVDKVFDIVTKKIS